MSENLIKSCITNRLTLYDKENKQSQHCQLAYVNFHIRELTWKRIKLIGSLDVELTYRGQYSTASLKLSLQKYK